MIEEANLDETELPFARRRIGFARTLTFTGRNGSFKCTGLEVIRSPHNSSITLEPVTSRDATGRCSIEIPCEQLAEVTDALIQLNERQPAREEQLATRPGKRYVVVMANGSDPEVSEPYQSEDEQDAAARWRRRENQEDVIMWATVDQDGRLEMQAYSNGFFEEDDDQEAEAA